MTDDKAKTGLWKQAAAVLQAPEREANLLQSNPDLLAAYAGEWVAVHDGRVIGHARDGAELPKIVNLRNFPGAFVGYIPTAEEQGGVFILVLNRAGTKCA